MQIFPFIKLARARLMKKKKIHYHTSVHFLIFIILLTLLIQDTSIIFFSSFWTYGFVFIILPLLLKFFGWKQAAHFHSNCYGHYELNCVFLKFIKYKPKYMTILGDKSFSVKIKVNKAINVGP